MRNLLIIFVLLSGSKAIALDPACTLTTNLSMNYCPSGSTDWYQSYSDIVNNLDALAKTAPSSFTVLGASGLQTNGPGLFTGNLYVNGTASFGAINMTSSSSTITNKSSSTASAFFGDGSHLTGISGTLSGGVTGEAAYWSSSTSLLPAAWFSMTSTTGTVVSGALGLNSGTTFYTNTGSSILSGGGVTMGTSTASGYSTTNGVIAFYMKSLDGVTQSSGCAVTYSMNDFTGTNTTSPGTMVFTSTNSTANNWPIGVLLENCAPLSFCRVGVVGPFLTIGTAPNVQQFALLSTTRCALNSSGTAGVGKFGMWLTGSATNPSNHWIMLGHQ